jgi:hypothetical protein
MKIYKWALQKPSHSIDNQHLTDVKYTTRRRQSKINKCTALGEIILKLEKCEVLGDKPWDRRRAACPRDFEKN